MWGGPDHPLPLVLLILAVPISLVTAAVVVIAVLALTARSASTRRHCLQVLQALTRFARVLRSRG
ncbi:hypothetical protein [Micromonospora sp. ATA51]|uniref:hypothetical protein n=1 Tax=Micromonospora sp. ATA51 TaxID=2806098 RepID=UPI001A572043|nr:hypothetical protein [Micromonospora sp. ATA51]MBM0226850.1 hypothetical protein [Micromonospora sp. ATA51]